MKNRSLGVALICSMIFWGCSKVPLAHIPEVPQDHPANQFYQFVSRNMVSDNVCLEYKGNPAIPMGEIASGEKFLRTTELIPGAFWFTEKSTGKKYLGVSFLQYQGLLQIPKLCAWEEPGSDVEKRGSAAPA